MPFQKDRYQATEHVWIIVCQPRGLFWISFWISYLGRATSLPVDFGRFWSSSNTKTKLSQLLREQLVDMPSCYCSAELVVSGVGGESPQHCQCAHNTTVAHLSGWTPCAAWISWNCDCVAVTRHECVLYWDSSLENVEHTALHN